MLAGCLRSARVSSSSRRCGATDCCNPYGDPVLQIEQLGKLAVKAIGPNHRSGLRLAQLDGDPQQIARTGGHCHAATYRTSRS